MRRLAPWQAYGLAATTTLAALGVRVAFDGAFRGYPGLLLFTLPILASAYAGGMRGGLMATVLSCLASQYLWWLPLRTLVFDSESYRWVQLFLATFGVTVSLLSESLHRARRRAQDAAGARQAAQDDLHRDSALLANAQRLAGLGVWDLEVASNALAWSEETLRIFGVTAESFGGTLEAFFALVHPDDLERVKSISFRPRPAGDAGSVTVAVAEAEYRIVRPDGEVRVVSERGGTTFDGHGRAVRKVGVVMDITERRRTEDALARDHGLLREAEARYRSLFENSNDGIFQNTPDGRLLTANPAMARMMGFASPEEMVGARTDVARQSYLHPELRGQFTRVLEDEGFINGFEYQVRRKDGATIWVSENVRVVRDAEGHPLLYEGSMQDVTARRLAQEETARTSQALQRQQTELRVLFDLMPAMIWFKDTEDRILRVNQRVAQSLGRSVEEIEGRPSVEIYPRDAARYRADDREVIESRAPKLGIVETLVDAAGSELWVETDKVPYFDEDGKVAGIVVMAQDITERKRSEAQLRKTHNQLLEVSRLGGMAEVATEVLHNVGNILNSVNVSAALVVENVRNSRASRMADVVALLRDHRDDLAAYITNDPAGRHIPGMLEALSSEWVDQQRLLVTELGELHRNVDLIKQVVASQQSHAVAPELIEFLPVEELVEDAVRVQQGVLSEQHVRLIRDFASVPPIPVPRHKVVRILVSLLRNGRQACRHLAADNRLITLRIEQLGGRAAISVSDNGAGIVAENLVKIFTPGFSTRPEAHGYGLHSAALAATELGGGLAARSDGPGKGATFTLELPLRLAVAA